MPSVIRKHSLQLLTILSLILLAWYKIIFQSFLGEGFTYFGFGFKEAEGFPLVVFRHDTGALFLFSLLKPIFRDNLLFYQCLLIFILIILGILFYLFVYELVGKKFIAFVATIFYSLNYGTTFEMVANGQYQHFVQRVFFTPLIFLSLIFFAKFFKKNSNFYFFLSLGFYTLGIIFARFNVFYLPFYLTYFLGIIIVNKSLFKKTGLFLRMSFFLVITVLLLYFSKFIAVNFINETPVFFINNLKLFAYHVVRQLAMLTFPRDFLNMILLIDYSQPLSPQKIDALFLLISACYLLVFLYLWQKKRLLRSVLFASFLFLPLFFVLNIYMRTDNVISLEYGSRYLYGAGIAFAIFWSLFFSSIFKINFMKPFVFIILFFWIFFQISTIWRKVDEDFHKHQTLKKSLIDIKLLSSKFTDDSVVILPSVFGPHAADFIQLYYGKKKTRFYSMSVAWHEQLKRSFNPVKDYILAYDFQEKKIVDITNQYPEIFHKKTTGEL